MATVANKLSPLSLDASCERIIAQFEQLREGDALAFTQSAIDSIAAQFRPALVTELARIELERNFTRDYLDEVDWKPSRFCAAFAGLFEDSQLRGELGFEHYRLARLHGLSVTRKTIGALYSVPFDLWKELPAGAVFENGAVRESAYPRIGESFCGYPLIAELGRGALARVYLARQTDLAGRLVVLKISSRLNAEADKLARLQHTNIVPVYSVHRSSNDDQLYAICMPYLGSLTLADLLTLFEGNSKGTGRIEELISTLVARRRSTLIATAQPTESIANPADPVSSTTELPQVSESPGLPANSQTSASATRLERQLGYDELMGTLHSLVQHPNDVRTACHLIQGIASGIAYAHSIGIVHRDLKPENLLIANDGRPVVLDFNLSDDSKGSRPNIEGGTLPYMSLQQLQSLEHERRVSMTDDVFAIGTIFYRLLSGRLPYVTRSLDDLTQLIEERKVAPVSLRDVAPHVPHSLNSIVLKCLATDEFDRYPSAVELVEDLTRFLENRTLRHAVDHSLIERAQRYARRNPVVTSSSFISALAGMAVLTIGIAWWWSTERASQLTQQLQVRQLVSTMPKLLAQLQGPYRDAPQLQRGIEDATLLLRQWRIDGQPSESSRQLPISKLANEQFRHLSDPERRLALEQLGQLTFALASAEGNLSVLNANEDVSLQHRRAALRWNNFSETLAPQLGPACRFQRSQINRDFPGSSGRHPGSDSASGDLTSADTPLAKLLMARQSGDWDGWLRWADVLAHERPNDANSWFNLGSAYYTVGNFERAWSCFDVSERLQTGSLTSIFWRGVTSHQLGNYARALDDFHLCLQDDPTWASARHNRALAAFALQELDEALSDTTYLIDKGIAGPRVWLLRSQIHALQGRSELAQADRRSALSSACQSADDWVAIGVQKLVAQPEQALDAFRTAQIAEPSNLAAWQNAAHVLSEQLKQPVKAIEEMDKLIALRPNQAGHYATRGILAARLGRTQSATNDAIKAGQLLPKAMEMLQIAGIYALLSQKTESTNREANISQSLDWLRRALLAEPQLARLAEQDMDLEAIHQEAKCKELILSAKTLNKMN